ncbi:hypothetical protein PHYBLDRAFT_143887 [Phycomyces blakesleeanus NRRL 1555(-)]|uniref:Uncharacterized protein n=1 Tax=Phycomyces blakesleeanus (strain ATCC 8743b / DSM 1359 / FGSC 10004 / NBRC 33097 / NRRL 1555) TaxID=763407 RepID=A0A162UJ43_PHYB8|nr:hypothetical protein PHYBLDRAFT_143887 [Phycomyces blakesleeanus NRRL 1555(-)]OAD75643.1 hypothetical protein PHYBLDRAFT_143887 [Phycomyces blakesleeanus NRRL 1555(-)]|eukprot:XP_018293683.1 hypothetical protein PHYBLDRAFT_143887 [Phycomyces blakesleeanus NRRL 1555(-)]
MSKAPNSSRFIESWIAKTEKETRKDDFDDLDQDMLKAIELSKQTHREEQTRLFAMFSDQSRSTSKVSFPKRRQQKSLFDDEDNENKINDNVQSRSVSKAADSNRKQFIPVRESIEELIQTHTTLPDKSSDKSRQKHIVIECEFSGNDRKKMNDKNDKGEEIVIEDVSTWLEELHSETPSHSKELINSSPPSSLIGNYKDDPPVVHTRTSYDSMASSMPSSLFGGDEYHKDRHTNKSSDKALNQLSSSPPDYFKQTECIDEKHPEDYHNQFGQGSFSDKFNKANDNHVDAQNKDHLDNFGWCSDNFDQIERTNSKLSGDSLDRQSLSPLSDQFVQEKCQDRTDIPDYNLNNYSWSPNSGIFGQIENTHIQVSKPNLQQLSSSPPSDLFGQIDQASKDQRVKGQDKPFWSPILDRHDHLDLAHTEKSKPNLRQLSSSPPSDLFGQINQAGKDQREKGQDKPSCSPISDRRDYLDLAHTEESKTTLRQLSSSPPSDLFGQINYGSEDKPKDKQGEPSWSPSLNAYDGFDDPHAEETNPTLRQLSSSPPSDLFGQTNCASTEHPSYTPRQLSSSPPSDLFGQIDYKSTGPEDARQFSSSPPLDSSHPTGHNDTDNSNEDFDEITSIPNSSTSDHKPTTEKAVPFGFRSSSRPIRIKKNPEIPEIPFSARKRSHATSPETPNYFEQRSSPSVLVNSDENSPLQPKEKSNQKHKIINPFKLDPVKQRRLQSDPPTSHNTEDVVGDFLSSWLTQGKTSNAPASVVPVFSKCPLCFHSFPDEVLQIHASGCRGGFTDTNDEHDQPQRTPRNPRTSNGNPRSRSNTSRQEDDETALDNPSTSTSHSHRGRTLVRQNRTIARSVARQDRHRHKPNRNETSLPAVNYYAEDDVLEGVEDGGFGGSLHGIAWESMGHTSYN